MPKYKAQVVETLAQVAYIYVEADSEDDAWLKADAAAYDISSSSFKVLDGDLQVDDIELEEEDGPCPLAMWYDTSKELE